MWRRFAGLLAATAWSAPWIARPMTPRAPPPSAPRENGDALFFWARAARWNSTRPDIIHDQKTIFGSWVTSTWLMEELVERLVRWNLHPADLVTHRFALDHVSDAYRLMASARCGKVAVCFDEELRVNS